MPLQPHPPNEPRHTPHESDGQLAAWAEAAGFLALVISGAALVATLLLLIILI